MTIFFTGTQQFGSLVGSATSIHNEEVHSYNPVPNIFTTIVGRRMVQANNAKACQRFRLCACEAD
jgi:hypothetical protein